MGSLTTYVLNSAWAFVRSASASRKSLNSADNSTRKFSSSSSTAYPFTAVSIGPHYTADGAKTNAMTQMLSRQTQ